ncbi:zinc-binding dehydrogenase [Aeromonas sp. 61P]|uniref:zinc-binding dehydrogenase n=1 Tax=Aeromonas sp. 61P TaxID=3452721 RepID=UPI003F7A70B2
MGYYFYGIVLKTRTSDYASLIEPTSWPFIERGEVKPQVYQTFPLHEAAAAHHLLDSGRHIGKLVLTMAPLSSD